jgi:hypothetical protein
VRAFILLLLGDVLGGAVDPGRVVCFEDVLDGLVGIAVAGAATDECRAITSPLRIGSV